MDIRHQQIKFAYNKISFNGTSTSASTLDKLAFHKSRKLRLTVAENPNTPIDTLVLLSKKHRGCFYVRQSAIKALMGKDEHKAGAAIAEFVSSSEP